MIIFSFIGYALGWIGLKRLKKGHYWVASAWGALMLGIQFYWFATPHYHGPLIFAAFGLICVAHGLLWGGFCVLVRSFPQRVVALASIWTLVEWARLHFLCGFAFHHVGMSLASTVYGQVLASVGGVLGLTFWVMLTNLLFLNDKRAWLVAAILPYMVGAGHLLYHRKQPSGTKRALLVQTGLFPDQKVPMPHNLAAFVAPIDQWKQALTYLQPADWIVLPEAAFPFSARRKLFTQEQAQSLFTKHIPNLGTWSHLDIATFVAKSMGAEVIIGLDDYDEAGNYNAVFHITKEGKISRYEKRRLLPIAESLPFEWLRPFSAQFGIQDFFSPGKEGKIVGDSVPLSLSICYDECFSSLVRDKAAKMHVNVTNDAWYPHSKLMGVHFQHAKLRAIENGIPLIRACNTGVTAAVDSLGQTVAALHNEDAGALIVDVPMYSYTTFFCLFGHWPLLILCFICCTNFVLRCSKKPLSAKVEGIA